MSKKSLYTVCLIVALSMPMLVCLEALGQVGWWPDPEPVKKELKVYRVDTPPRIDGDLTDAAWTKLPRYTGMTDITFEHAYVADQVLFFVGYDQANLYIALDIRDRFPELIKATAKGRDTILWSLDDDTIELFFDPEGQGKDWIQLACNPIGTQWDGRKAPKAAWNGNWLVATKRTKSGWTAEFQIPWADLSVKPREGLSLRANIARTSAGGKTEACSSWSIVEMRFHNTREYSHWILSGPAVQSGPVEDLRVNQEFVKKELGNFKELVSRSSRTCELIQSSSSNKLHSALSELTQSTEQLAEKLQAKASNVNSLDTLLEARHIASRLNENLETIRTSLCLNGITGPCNGLGVTSHGITREGNYWILSGLRGVYAITVNSGVLAGMWDRKINQRVITASFDLYSAETSDRLLRSEEIYDKVTGVEKKNKTLTLTCENSDLPELTMIKRYQLLNDGRILSKHIQVQGNLKDRMLFSISSKTLFDPQFREASMYNRMMSCGASGGSDQRATIPAREIVRPVIQRGGNNKKCGCAQFCLANLKTETGVAQYLYTLKDQYVWMPYAMPSSYWNLEGWEMSVLGIFLGEPVKAAETRYHLFDGDQIGFYKEYLQLPEVKAARKELPANPTLMAGIKAEGEGTLVTSAFSKAFLDGVSPRLAMPNRRLRSDEYNIDWGLPRHTLFSHWPCKDDDELIFINENSGDKTRANIGQTRQVRARVRELFPRHLVSLYWVHTDVHPDTDTYKKHPEFVIKGKDGSMVLATHPYGAYEADMSKEYTDYVVPHYAKMYDHLGLDFLYFDFFGGSSMPDWGQGRVLQSTDYMYFDKSIRAMLQKRKGFLFFNGNPGQLYLDVNYMEALGDSQSMDLMGKEWWRFVHERLMYYKLMERENTITIPLSWANYRSGPSKGKDNNRDYTNMLLSLGFRAHTCYYEYDLELRRPDGTIDWTRMYNYEEPYKQATLEMHDTRLVDVGQTPRYWTDPKCTVEAYILKKGPGYFVTAINHDTKKRDVTVMAETSKLGFVPGKRLFRWDYTRRDDNQIPRLIGPETPRWDRLFTHIRCTVTNLDNASRLNVTFPNMEVNFAYVATLTQVPGVFVSKEGQEMQFRLPETLQCRLEGEADEAKKCVTLKAETPIPAVVAAWWPREWSKPRIEVNEKSVPSVEFVFYGQERFVLVPIGKESSYIRVMP
ncbi:MAG: sugar-binding protein [Phycisphaerae bacterium]